MPRRRAVRQDSLELLLDTICNTFGGVLFIAILVVLLLRQTSISPDNSTPKTNPVSEVEMQSLANQLDAASGELSRLIENRNSQEVIVARFAPSEVQDLLKQRRDITSRQNELQSQVDAQRVENTQVLARTEATREEIERIRVAVEEATERNRRAAETLEKEKKSRVQEVRLPVTRSSHKTEIGLILRYGKLYVWHRYGPGNERLGLNTDEFIVVSDDGDELVTRPIPTRGVPLNASPAAREAIRSRLSKFDPRTCYLVAVVRPDSFHAFKHLRDEAIALKFEYRLMPAETGSPVADRGGRGGVVQ